ncbi:MAG TPA: hypothetical protein VGK36_01680 [Candidatus Angelobacter sp.]
MKIGIVFVCTFSGFPQEFSMVRDSFKLGKPVIAVNTRDFQNHNFANHKEHDAAKLLDSRDSRLRHGGLPHENHPHRNSFLRAINRNSNNWRRRKKAGESGNHQGSRLLHAMSAALS